MSQTCRSCGKPTAFVSRTCWDCQRDTEQRSRTDEQVSAQTNSEMETAAATGLGRCPVCQHDIPLTRAKKLLSAHNTPGRTVRCAGGGTKPAAARAAWQPSSIAAPAVAAPASTAIRPASAVSPALSGVPRRTRVLAAAGVAASILAGAFAVSWSLSADDVSLEATAVAAETSSTPSPRPSRTPRPTATPRTTTVAGGDAELRAALTKAGIGEALVTRIGQVGRQTGYLVGTVDREDEQTFAYMQVLTCQEVNSGYRSYDDVFKTDVTDGAPSASAQTMVTFLRTTYCPAVKPEDATATAAPATGMQLQADGSDPDGMRGLLSTAGYFDAAYQAVPVARCSEAVGPETDARAYQTPAGALLCVNVPGHAAWRGHMLSVDIVFDPPVSQKTALAAALAVMPGDTTVTGEQPHTNPVYAPYPGSCHAVQLSSPKLGAKYATLKTPTTNGAYALMYTGRRTNTGTDARYDASRVRQVNVGHGDDEPNLNGEYSC